jgi:hypothetical protein
MPVEPPVKRALAFIDGQNLFHNVRKVFSYNMGRLQVLRQVSIPGETRLIISHSGCRFRRPETSRLVTAPSNCNFWACCSARN